MVATSRVIKRFLLFTYKKSRTYLKKYYGINKEMNRSLGNRSMRTNGMFITEHAIIRYFERVEGYDIEKIRQNLAPEWLASKAKNSIGKYQVGNLTVAVCEGYVVTVYKADNKLQNTMRVVVEQPNLLKKKGQK